VTEGPGQTNTKCIRANAIDEFLNSRIFLASPSLLLQELISPKKKELSVDIKEARDVKKIVIDFPTRIRRPGEL
jgi:hypothetical protein